MIHITDAQMGALHTNRRLTAPGVYAAPCAVAEWDGYTLTLRPTGLPVDAAVAAVHPHLARLMATPAVAALPQPDPTVTALEADYSAATAALAAWWPLAPETTFRTRLNQGCRACDMWDEAAHDGRGRCDSVRCHCARRRIWRAAETCPEGRWPA
jgi:hypothetical protein